MSVAKDGGLKKNIMGREPRGITVKGGKLYGDQACEGRIGVKEEGYGIYASANQVPQTVYAKL